jgi:hypothetical protein
MGIIDLSHRNLYLSSFLITTSCIISSVAADYSSNVSHFDLTAIAAKDGRSLFQCWQLVEPLTVSNTAGIAGARL